MCTMIALAPVLAVSFAVLRMLSMSICSLLVKN
jgi:hypothetical protein